MFYQTPTFTVLVLTHIPSVTYLVFSLGFFWHRCWHLCLMPWTSGWQPPRAVHWIPPHGAWFQPITSLVFAQVQMWALVYPLGFFAVWCEGGDSRRKEKRVQLRFFHLASSAKLAGEAEWFWAIVGLTRAQLKPVAHFFWRVWWLVFEPATSLSQSKLLF